jgi:mono/diheme cytochrome c family protein
MLTMRPSLLALGAVAALGLIAAQATPVSYKLPEETAAFKPGPNLDVVKNDCTGCHSADYISTQPGNVKSKKDFWQTEVTKMIKLYGAPIDQADIEKIVEYLASTY